MQKTVWMTVAFLSPLLSVTLGSDVGPTSDNDLVVSNDGKCAAVIVVSPAAGPFERRAADDLAKYIEMMCGDRPKVADTASAVRTATAGHQPQLIVGQEAFRAHPPTKDRLAGVLKTSAHLRTDGVVLLREGQRVYVAGNNDRSHYFAVAELLRRWGCRWYLPTVFGECIPDEPNLRVGDLNYAYSSPFEVRTYWISWNGDSSGSEDFRLRNMMTERADLPPTGHALGRYTRGLGQGTFEFPITAPETARHVAEQVSQMYSAGQPFSLGMEDGSYDSDDPKDQRLMKLQWDKYFLRWSVTDPMLELYNNVAGILQKTYPDSGARIGFLAYANMTIPPVRDMTAEPSLFCELAPIDIDPIHGMDDPQSPPRQEFRDMLYKWADVMQGRLTIYDYDQGMLVWRDLPNPSHQAFRQDVQHYRKAGILGVNTESRNAIATTFLNLYLRARLLWNPDIDVDGLLNEFYTSFYGPAAKPMAEYWNAIFKAWEQTLVTEHEYFVAPAIYTPELLDRLRKNMATAEQVAAGLKGQKRELTRLEKQYVTRVQFTGLSHEIVQQYLAMVRAAATECDYASAVVHGTKALAVREQLTDLNGTFTTYRNIGESGYPWFPGEVNQYTELQTYINGARGRLITRLPLEWASRRDKSRQGAENGYTDGPIDLSYWNDHKQDLTHDNRRDYPDQWEILRVDLYAQAQGIRDPDRQSYTGGLWYRTTVELTADQVRGSTHILFPGLFNQCLLYINGQKVAYREEGRVWWLTDYRFEWDVNLSGILKPGRNTIALYCNVEHHFGGMFRRPFLYEPTAEE